MKGINFKKAGICISIPLTAAALLILQLSGGGRLPASNPNEPMNDPVLSTRVIAEHPPVELLEKRDDHTRVYEIVREVETTHPDGSVTVETIKSYIHEKGSGLCYKDASGSYVPSVAEWRETPDGFVIDRCPYRLAMGKTIGVTARYTVEGHDLLLRPAYLIVSDGINQSHLATLNPDAPGVIVPGSPSVLRFPAAFGPGLDLEYVAGKGGFHHNLIIGEAPRLPARFDPRNTAVFLYTEMNLDEYLGASGVQVFVEEAEIDAGAPDLLSPPSVGGCISFCRPSGTAAKGSRIVHAFGLSRVTDSSGPGALWRQTMAEKRLLKESSTGTAYLVESLPFSYFIADGASYPMKWDYEEIEEPISGGTWEPGGTYWVKSTIWIEGILTINHGAVVKLNPSTEINIVSGGELHAVGYPGDYVILTNAADTEYGESVPAPPGPWQLAFDIYSGASAKSVIRYCNLRHGQIGIYLQQALTEPEPIAHNIFVDMYCAIEPYGISGVDVHNNLMASCTSYTIYAYNVYNGTYTNNTIDCASAPSSVGICDQGSSYFTAKDNVFSNCTTGIYTDNQYNADVTHNGFFNVAGGYGSQYVILAYDPFVGYGEFFLDQSCEFIDAGSRSAADAGFGTGWSTAISYAEEEGTVDLGFHRYSADSDGDGMPDAWEAYYFGSLSEGATDDHDDDGRENFEEYDYRLNPDNNDTDGDGTIDGRDSAPGKPSFAKDPYLQNVKYSGSHFYITVMVETPHENAPSIARCRPSDSPEGPWYESTFHATAEIVENEHYAHEARFHIPDAQADEQYTYKVGLNGGQLAEYDEVYLNTKKTSSFKTFPEYGAPWRFVVYGDSRTNYSNHLAVVNAILTYSDPADNPMRFVLHSADFVHDGGQYAQWGPQFFTPAYSLHKRIPIFESIGNHEYRGEGEEPSKYLAFFDLPEGYEPSTGDPVEKWYSFDYRNCHFIVLDTERDAPADYIGPGTDQYNWLVTDISSKKAKTADWVIVLFHIPPYTDAVEGDGHQYGDGDVTSVRDNLTPVFEDPAHPADLVFSGHNHFYERSQAERSGYWVHYVVTGGGGADLHTPGPYNPERVPGKAEDALHHCVIDINGTTATLNVLKNDGSYIEQDVILTPGQEWP